jgi:hypothetical protein
MARFKPQTYNLAGVDPKKSDLAKLFLFWHAYDEEAKLLQEWHEDTATAPKPTGNVLFDSFLVTWGDRPWNTNPSPKNTYFQALGVVSAHLRQKIRDSVLDEFLVPEGTGFKLPPTLKDPKKRDQAERRAKDEIAILLDAFNDPEIPGLEKVDKEAEKVRDTSKKNFYLSALVRMMNIETGCFKIQKRFLEKGEVLAEDDLPRG